MLKDKPACGMASCLQLLKNKMNIKFLQIIIFIFFFLPACQQDKDHSGPTSKVHHVVVCWLNGPGNEEARQKVIEVSRGFSAIPGVIDVRAGSVIQSEREIVDSSFDAAIYLTFENEQKLFEYLNHPIHKKAVKKLSNHSSGRLLFMTLLNKQHLLELKIIIEIY